MTGEPKIYVDFTIRDPEGRFFVASLRRFPTAPSLGDTFVATDHEEFDGIECQILAIDHEAGRVYHRPVDPRSVPGTIERSAAAAVEESRGIAATDVRPPVLAR